MTRKTGAPILYGSLLSAGLVLVPLSSPLAETATGTLEVSAEVVAMCHVAGGGTSLNFGAYNPADGDRSADALFAVVCTTQSPVTVALDEGENEEDGKRHMKGGPEDQLLEYGLYKDDAHQDEFGGGTGPGMSEPITGMPGAGTTVSVYGLIPGGQTVATGNYSDSVQISLDF